MMLMTIAAIMVPYLYSELRRRGSRPWLSRPQRQPPGSGADRLRVLLYGAADRCSPLFYLLPLLRDGRRPR